MFEAFVHIPAPGSLYEAHQSVWGAIRGGGHGACERDFLFRVRANGSRAIARVRSHKPVPGHPVSRLVVPSQGNEYGFSLLCHPVRRVNGRQEYGIPAWQIKPWLTEMFARNGMRLVSLPVVQTFRAPFGKDGHDALIRAASLSGSLAVDDERKAQEAWAKGLGRMKGMGFGMLELEEV